MANKLDTFTKAYVECALWAETDENGDSLDNYSMSDVAEQTFAIMEKDCLAFQHDNAALLERWYGECGETPERAGHDFWLTRNHHGAGYWDRWAGGTAQGKIGQELTEKAHEYGSCDLYVTDRDEIEIL